VTRTNIFVSYSHKDEEWLGRLKEHIAVLQRGGLVKFWSDLEMAIGTNWELEIEAALSRSKAAVLLVSPAFLASEYVWAKEMPRIITHVDQGMEALPLIVRPCAWKLEPFLAQLLARPREPLSLGSSSQIDSDLSDFTYEVAIKIGRWTPPKDKLITSDGELPKQGSLSWTGIYMDTLAFRLIIHRSDAVSFEGKIEYPDYGTITTVKGAIHQTWSRTDPAWRQIGAGSSEAFRRALTFKELNYEQKGNRTIDFTGEYRALVSEIDMVGAWFNRSGLIGRFAAKQDVAD